ncbi:hypothetical protein CYMTET_37568 [Cymbomonas tetramitiformis]|uniref:Integrase catalytic domain-containing protein n=1 Tax=Cymbomonas tetramitiformis TaxID=36881 RepID=A0AAE0F6I9_9CHLO|nr:hypothetical protein CYMTET_37568 [Cymbomonas tetramitiformis]
MFRISASRAFLGEDLDVKEIVYDLDLLVLQSDNDTTIIAGQTAEYCRQHGILQRTMAPYLHDNNARVDLYNHLVQAKARAMLVTAGLPASMWPLACRHAVYLLNRVVKAELGMQSSMQVLNQKVDLTSLLALEQHVWGFLDIDKKEECVLIDVKQAIVPVSSLPAGAKALGMKAVYKLRFDAANVLTERKSRWIIFGNKQSHGVNYEEVYSPCTQLNTLRILIQLRLIWGLLAFTMDVVTCLLNSELDIEAPLYASSTVMYSSKLQKTVAMSTVDGELVALSETARDIEHVVNLLSEFAAVQLPVVLRGDNHASIIQAESALNKTASRHIAVWEVRDRYVVKLAELGRIRIVKVPSSENLADFFTKSMPTDRFLVIRQTVLRFFRSTEE